MPTPDYFEQYTNLHRLASEALLFAVSTRNERQLDEAERYAHEALKLAETFYEMVLTHAVLHAISLEHIVFRADQEGKMPELSKAGA